MSQVVLNIYVNGVKKIQLQSTIADNARSILNEIGGAVTKLKHDGTLTPNMVLDKVVVIPKAVAIPEPEHGFFGYFKSNPKSDIERDPVDLIKLSTMVIPDTLKNLSVEPTVDVHFSTPVGGRRRSCKSRKNRKSRKRR